MYRIQQEIEDASARVFALRANHNKVRRDLGCCTSVHLTRWLIIFIREALLIWLSTKPRELAISVMWNDQGHLRLPIPLDAAQGSPDDWQNA